MALGVGKNCLTLTDRLVPEGTLEDRPIAMPGEGDKNTREKPIWLERQDQGRHDRPTKERKATVSLPFIHQNPLPRSILLNPVQDHSTKV